jgi:hypothetical protein
MCRGSNFDSSIVQPVALSLCQLRYPGSRYYLKIQLLPLREKHGVSNTNTNRIIFYGETIAAYSENRTKHINPTFCRQNAGSLNVKASNIYIYKTKLRGFGPRANNTDRATAACWRISANFCG